MADLEIHYCDDWAALYVDGDLVQVGDSYLAEERAFQIMGVKTIHDDGFMRGGSSREGVASTLADIVAYRTSRDAQLQRVMELRAEADALMKQADALEFPK